MFLCNLIIVRNYFQRFNNPFLIGIVILLFISMNIHAQTGVISGTVVNKENQTALNGANVLLDGPDIRKTTDDKGKFIIEGLPTGSYTISVSFVGYKTTELEVEVKNDTPAFVYIELNPASLVLGEVTVSSYKYEKYLKEIPIPIGLQTSEEILSSPALTVSDAVKNIPGVSLTRDGIWETTVNIRGLSRSSVVTLIDGNRVETATDISAGLSLIDLADIERIEIIKGAASALYGTGATGGVVNIFTKSAYFNKNYYYNGRLTGTYNSVNNQPAVNLTLNSGASNWYVHLSGMFRKADNVETPQGTLLNSQFEDNNISASFGLKPFTNHELKLSYQQFNAENVGIPGGSSLFPSKAEVRYPKEMRRMASAEYKINSISQTLQSLSMKIFHQFILRDVENIPYTVQNVPASGTQPPRRVSVLKITPGADHNVNGFQVQSNWTLADNNYLIAGIDGWQREYNGERERYQKIEVLNPNTQAVVKTINKIIGEKPIPDSRFLSIGFYAQDEIGLIKNKLNSTVGGRIDFINVKNDKTYNPVYEITDGIRSDAPAGQILWWDEKNINEVSYSGNINFLYKAFQDIDFTLSIAHSFRSPSLEERYQYIDQGNVIRLGDPDLKPEKGLFFNLGIRVWKDKLNLTGDLFYNTLRDIIVELPGTYEGRNALIKTNIGKAELYGFELGAEYSLLQHYIVYTSLSYTRGKDKYNNTDLPQIPPLNGRLGAKSNVLHFVEADLSATFFDAQKKVAAGELTTPGYVTLDFYLSSIPFELGFIKLQAFAGVENLLDKAYRNHLSTNRGLITIEPGRNIFARLSINW
ncbi:MAG: TonB-dependent receptor [Ignavibacteriales bacterium]|nr:MAG: TonB-dependent receptor [Ignavibacteriales bacterium]